MEPAPAGSHPGRFPWSLKRAVLFVRYIYCSPSRTTCSRPRGSTAVIVCGRPTRAVVDARLAAAIDDLDERLGGLPSPTEAEDIWADPWHQEAHHSTALEGNTLVLNEVRRLLDEGRAVGAKELREYMEVRGYADAATWVYGQALEPGDWTTGDLISRQEVRAVHRAPGWAGLGAPEAASAPPLDVAHDLYEVANLDTGWP